MKKTYKLLGKHFDRLPLPTTAPEFYNVEEHIRKYNEEYDLFDLKKYIRTIPISDFLSSKDMKEVEAILQKVEYCEIIVVEVNFYPTAKNHIVMQFIVKRLLQIYELINSVCVDSSIYIMANKEVQTMIYQLYKVDE